MRLVAPSKELVGPVLDFYVRNRAHLAPWGPPTVEKFFTEADTAARMTVGEKDFDADRAWRWWMMPKDEPDIVIGHAHFSQIHFGAFQNAMLGYSVDADYEGKGFMSEALRGCLEEVFGPRGGLHRVQANVRPENERSLVLLERIGFRREGLAEKYLFIDGEWRDHVMLAMLHPESDRGLY